MVYLNSNPNRNPNSNLEGNCFTLGPLRRNFGIRWMVPAAEICCVCAEPFDSEHRLAAIGKCNHTDACSLCYLRLRMLLNNFECVVCRERLRTVYVWRGTPSENRDWDTSIRPSIWGEDAGPK